MGDLRDDGMIWTLISLDNAGRVCDMETFSTKPKLTPTEDWPSRFILREGYLDGGDSVTIAEGSPAGVTWYE